MFDFFIAHASVDKAPAESLYNLLSKSHNTFLDKATLETGDSWNKVLAESLENSRVIVILLSEQSIHAYYLQEEIARAIQHYRNNQNWYRLVPVYLNGFPSNLAEIPYGLYQMHSLDLKKDGSMEAIAQKLISFSTKEPADADDVAVIKAQLTFAHPLLAFPVGPMVPSHLVPVSLIEAFAAMIETTNSRETIDQANAFRKEADPLETGSILIKQIELIEPNKNKPKEFWQEAFRQARLHGPRMLAALLLTVEDRFFPKKVRDEKNKLLEILKTLDN